MLRFALVLLLAQCALGAQVLQVSPQRWSPTTVTKSGLVSSSVIANSYAIKDGGETSLYILTGQKVLEDLADKPDFISQILALSGAISVLIEVSTGLPGDACSYAQLIRASSGSGDLNAARKQYAKTLCTGIDNIISLANSNPSVWTSVPSTAVCSNTERWYDIDTVWSNIITGYPLDASLLNELYCSARRLAAAWNIRSNNVGAALTAAVTPAAINLWAGASDVASNFLNDLAIDNRVGLTQSAQNLKAALIKAA